MGCISSKILTKSLREDLSHRCKTNRIAAASGIPPDDLFLGKSEIGRSSNSWLPNVEMINTWELMAGLEEQVEQKHEAETKAPIQLSWRGKDSVEEEDNKGADDDIKEMLFPITTNTTIEESTSFKDVVIQERKGLESIGSLREWLLGGGGGGVTPKLGNYDDKSCGEEWEEEPELLAAFEEFIQQLEIEGHVA